LSVNWWDPLILISSLSLLSVSISLVDQVITFDDYGVSGHPNHIATSRGVSQALSRYNSLGNHSIHCLQLQSTNCLRKFMGFIDLLWSRLTITSPRDILVLNPNILLTFSAMSAHASQFVWYRRVFLLLSRYTYLNTLSFVQLS
jgi:N-acetylglucosaminylphosphatidylinositol deacetylase